MSASEECKAAGLKGLSELALHTGYSRGTLYKRHKDNKPMFSLLIENAVKAKYLKQAAKR